MNNSEIKKRQMEVLERFLSVCSKFDIKCCLYYGSLLGCVRHQGYIPWDDDIDLAMHRSDYEKLKEIDFAAFGLKLLMPGVGRGSPYLAAKVYDPTTLLIEDIDCNSYELGINVDVFPIDAAVGFGFRYALYRAVVGVLKKVYLVKVVRLNKRRSYFKNFILLFCKLFVKPLNLFYFSKCLDNISISSQEENQVSGVFLGPYGYREMMPSHYFNDIEYLSFEGLIVPVPKKWDLILKRIYGDYMELPPVEKRVAHHSFTAYDKNCD